MKKTSLIYSVLILCSFIAGCDKKEEGNLADCGCDGKVEQVIPESSAINGQISYLNAGGYQKDRFWIMYSLSNSPLITYYNFIVCNEDMLTEEIKALKNTPGKSLTIQFSGALKETCEKPMNNTNGNSAYVYKHIIISKIIKFDAK